MKMNLKSDPINTDRINQESVSFVDDKNTVINFSEPERAQEYLKMFFEVLKIFHSANQLHMNEEKTNLLVINKLNKNKYADKIELVTKEEIIKPEEQIRVLGWLINQRISLDSNANEVVRQVCHMMNTMNGIGKYMSTKTRATFAKSHLLSRIKYGLPLYAGETEEVKGKIYAATMKIARWCRKSYCFKESITSICKSISIDTPDQSLSKSTAKFIHSILSNRKPSQILCKIRTPRSRAQAKIALKYKHNSSKFERTLLFRSIKIYNESIPDDMKLLNSKDFNKRIKIMKLIKPG